MSKIIPVNITTAEQAVTLDATYQFVWLRNMGENDCLLSDHSDIVAGDDDVMTVKAGESGRIATSGRAVYVKAVSGTSTGEIHAQNFSDCPFRNKAKGGGQSITVEPLTVTDNGVYTAPTGKAYSPVSVDVQEQPWQPLQDGYSNFWFELTNDTLSPRLNFSAKNNDAVIDWGDGSGEQPLDTLTPTHIYSKAGRYVVKVKGVTGIGVQNIPPLNGDYLSVLKNVELNSEVTTISNVAFRYEIRLRNVVCHGSVTVGASALAYCSAVQSIDVPASVNMSGTTLFSTCLSLKEYVLPNGTTEIGTSQFYSCGSLAKITIPQNVVSIGNLAFSGCNALSEIHIQATTPPTVGTNAFQNIASGYVIYVPTGTLSAYQTAWSAYADHILEEGQQPNRMMMAKFNSDTTDNEEMR